MKFKKTFAALLSAGILLPLASCNAMGDPKSEKEKLSYAIGMNVAGDLKRQASEDVDVQWIVAGIKAGFAEKGSMTTEEARTTIQDYFRKKQQTQMAESGAKGAENLEKGKAFLEANKAKEGVKVTASGLQYKVLKQGSGPKPKASDKVKVHYTGTLIDGTKFDSSVDRGEPAVFGVGQVIQGWIEGLQLMNVGSKYTFYIPSNLAYGERQQGPVIGPNSVLVFDVELLDIVK